jgi:hypothetical protein
MRDLALQASGALAIFVAIIHGAIAELRERRERAGADRTTGADVDRSGTPHGSVTSTSPSKASPSAVSDNANLIARALAMRAINT